MFCSCIKHLGLMCNRSLKSKEFIWYLPELLGEISPMDLELGKLAWLWKALSMQLFAFLLPLSLLIPPSFSRYLLPLSFFLRFHTKKKKNINELPCSGSSNTEVWYWLCWSWVWSFDQMKRENKGSSSFFPASDKSLIWFAFTINEGKKRRNENGKERMKVESE